MYLLLPFFLLMTNRRTWTMVPQFVYRNVRNETERLFEESRKLTIISTRQHPPQCKPHRSQQI